MPFACLNRRRRVAEVVTLSTDGVLALSLRAWERDGVGTRSKDFSRVFPQTVASSHPATSSGRSPFPLRNAAFSFRWLMIMFPGIAHAWPGLCQRGPSGSSGLRGPSLPAASFLLCLYFIFTGKMLAFYRRIMKSWSLLSTASPNADSFRAQTFRLPSVFVLFRSISVLQCPLSVSVCPSPSLALPLSPPLHALLSSCKAVSKPKTTCNSLQ